MPIDGLSPTASLIAALRSELTKAERKRGHVANESAQADTVRRNATRDTDALRKQLSTLARGVRTDDEHALAQLRPRIVKTILLWEFGANLREHPEWNAMLDTIVATLADDPRYTAQFARMVRDLQA